MPSGVKNCVTQTIVPRWIVIHRSETGLTGPEVAAAESKTGCGYHYFVDKEGLIDQLAPENALVWHALHWSRSGLGIAVYGDFDPKEKSRNAKPTDAQLRSLCTLVAEIWERWGPMPVVGHTDLPGATAYPNKICPGPNLDVGWIQRAALKLYEEPKLV